MLKSDFQARSQHLPDILGFTPADAYSDSRIADYIRNARVLVQRGVQKIHPFGRPGIAATEEAWRAPSGTDESFVCSCALVRRSPLREEILGKLIVNGVTGLGLYAGLSIVPAAANPFIMLSCVAGGIIVVSTAAGIGRALQDGLYERIYNALRSNDADDDGRP